MKKLLICVAFLLALSAGKRASADVIELTGGSGDVFILYNSAANSGAGAWATVFRAKGTAGEPTTTVATGLTSPFNNTSTPATWTGILGNEVATTPGHTGDYTFTSLTTKFTTDKFLTLGTTTFAISRALGSPFNNAGNSADLGIRVRLREDEVAMGIGSNTAADQFASLNLTLDLTKSTFTDLSSNTSSLADGLAHVSLIDWFNDNSPNVLINTTEGNLTASLGIWGHRHRNWGFSESGFYDLAFDIEGVGGTYAGATGSFNMAFNVSAVPEPSSMCLVAATMGLAAWRLRRRRPLSTDDEAIPTV